MENKYIATISKTKEILEKFDMKAKKNFGQNFIIDPNIVINIAKNAIPFENCCVIEVGPGIGALSEQLAIRAKKVICYEIDERLPEVLDYSLAKYPNVEVRLIDFLKVDLKKELEMLKKEYDHIVLASNLPYYITTPILFKIFEEGNEIELITVMMQKEVGQRFAACPNSKDYNALSVITQYRCDVKILFPISRHIFNPAPNVDSVVVQFKNNKKYEITEENKFFALVKACFVQRRKTIYNNLSTYLQSKEKAAKLLEKADISPNLRAESLTLEKFVDLYKHLD